MIAVTDDVTSRADAQPDGTELTASETPTGHAYAWALDDGDDADYVEQHGWRPVVLRAAGVFAVFLATAGMIVALWWTQGRDSAPGQRSSIPASSTVAAPVPPVALPPATATAIETVPDVRTEVAPPPKMTPVILPPPVANPAVDQAYLGLLREHGITATAGSTGEIRVAHIACNEMGSGWKVDQVVAQVLQDNPGFVGTNGARDLVDAAIAVYCPQYAG